MQQTQSAVDFSNLLNPDNDGLNASHQAPFQQQPSGGDMASATLRPNGPLPGVETTNELPRPYKCPLCDKAFHRLEHQTRHIRTHTGEKPHVCQFPGCPKKFSRSDELMRHTRIHTTPNSRRGNKSQPQHQPLVAPDGMMRPPAPRKINSAPPSAIASPNVSPPHSYSSYTLPQAAPSLHPYPSRSHRSHHQSMDINMLARAANQVESEIHISPGPVSHLPRHQQRQPPYYSQSLHSSRGNLPSLSQYHMGNTRSHPGDDQDDHYSQSYRQPKRSRPNSPNSTAPSSPTFSHDSLSPTPDHTPLATPAHSPRLRPYAGIELPTLRNLSLQHTPTLAPLEPSLDPVSHFQPLPATATRSTGMSLSDIMNRPDATDLKLPALHMPKVSSHGLTIRNDGYHGAGSGKNSMPGSIPGGDMER